MRCPACPKKFRCLLSDGPETASILCIGTRPGATEQFSGGRPFIGDSGKELNKNYLPLAGLDRDEVRITNTVRCYAEANKDPTEAEIASCAGFFMPGEVESCRPQTIVTLGAVAASLVEGLDLGKEHGIPRWLESNESKYFGDWSGWVVPMYHPASGLHNTSMMIPMLEDWENFGRWRRGKWKAPTSHYAVDYRIADVEGVKCDFRETGAYRFLPLDTEDNQGKPWSIQYSTRPGMGRIVFVDDAETLCELRRSIKKEVVLHNAPHDLAILEQLGIHVTKFRDTMQEAYHLGNLPQGLKDLAYRLCGVRMKSWDDLVTPYSRKLAVDWLMEAWEIAGESPERVEKQLKTKVSVSYKPSELERGIKRILSHSHKLSYNIWEKADELDMTSLNLPPMPRKSIAHVPLEEAIHYACQDADIQGRVTIQLEQRRKLIMEGEWKVDEEDWDV